MIHDLIPQLNRMPCTVSQTPFVVAIFSQGCHRSLIASPRGVSKTDSWGLAPNQRINIPSTLSCSGDPHACWSLKSQLMGEGEQAAGTAPRTGAAGQRRPRAQAEPAGWAGFGAMRGEAPGRGGAGGKATAGSRVRQWCASRVGSPGEHRRQAPGEGWSPLWLGRCLHGLPGATEMGRQC